MSQHVILRSTNDNDGETVRPAFSEVPSGPHLSYNLSFDKACAKHVEATFKAERVYILASRSLCRNTKYVERLRSALGSRVAGLREGMTPHTLWNEVLEVADDCRRLRADLIVTIGGGSLTDAAKIVTLVSEQMRKRPICKCRWLTARAKHRHWQTMRTRWIHWRNSRPAR
jgi:alcohol dehydrogenase class IV